MALHDLRQYIDALESNDLLRRVKTEVDWNLEIGAITRLVCERREPAPLFENIKDYPGHRMLGVAMGPSKPALHARIAVGLGQPPRTPVLDLIEVVREGLRRPVAPIVVDRQEAPCKDVVRLGVDADLFSLPSPWIKSIDGGRYVGTWDIVVTRDPDSGWVNWGIYRCMILDSQSFGILLFPGGQHGGSTLAKYEKAGKPMPIAVVIGADPQSHLAAAAPLPDGDSEAEVAGGLLGGPVPLVKCETSDLLVPATAEIVVEAEILPGARAPEGPFGEYTGHAAHRGISPVARITAITHRADPIFTMANMGKPWDDAATPLSVLVSALAKDRLEKAGLPIRSAYQPAPQTAMVVSVEPGQGMARKVFDVLHSGYRLFQQGLVLVDTDVDVTSIEDVWWAIATRLRPDGMTEVPALPITNLLNPHLNPDEREARIAGAWILDASLPAHWSPEYRATHTVVSDFTSGFAPEVKQRVLERWTEYGLD